MELETEKIGKIKYNEEDIYHLPLGLFGFEGEKEFILYKSENVHPFIWFQSQNNPKLAFLLIDPRLIRDGYQLGLKRSELQELKIEEGDESNIYTIASIRGDDINNITVNFQGPLVFNLSKRLVQQVVIENQPLQEPLLQTAVH